MPANIDWRDVHTSLWVYKTSSLKSAAKSLSLSEGTVSRRVKSLENALGVILFCRTPSGMTATRSGIKLFDHVIEAEQLIEKGVESTKTAQESPSGSVRITTVPILANYVLTTSAKTLVLIYPKLELNIIGDSAELSILRRDADIALRLNRPCTEPENITKKIGELKYGVFSASGSMTCASTPNELPWVTYNEEMERLPQARWIANYASRYSEAISPIRYNDAEGVLGAVKSGQGKSLLPLCVASGVPELQELTISTELPKRELWLVVHPNIIQTKRIRVVIDWLCSLF